MFLSDTFTFLMHFLGAILHIALEACIVVNDEKLLPRSSKFFIS